MNWEDERRDAWHMIVFICAIWAMFFVGFIVIPAKNRIVTPMEESVEAPEFTLESLRSGEYGIMLEDFARNRFVNREKKWRLGIELDTLLGKRDNGSIYLGEEDYLFRMMLPQEYEGKEEAALQRIEELLNKYPQMYVAPVPTKECILEGKLPAFAPNYNQKPFCDALKGMVPKEQYLDLYELLTEHKKEDIFFKSDSHLTMLSTLYIYDLWVERREFPPRHYKKENMFVLNSNFLGDLYEQDVLKEIKDTLMIIPQLKQKEMKVSYDNGEETNTLYSKNKLFEDYPYDYYLDGNHAVTEIETGYRAQGRELVLLKDSYANELVPLLVPYYSKIYVIDMEHCHFDLDLYMAFHNTEKTDILLMQSVESLLKP